VKKFSSRVNDFLRGSGHNLKVIGKLWFNYKIMYRILIAEDEVKIAAFMSEGDFCRSQFSFLCKSPEFGESFLIKAS